MVPKIGIRHPLLRNHTDIFMKNGRKKEKEERGEGRREGRRKGHASLIPFSILCAIWTLLGIDWIYIAQHKLYSSQSKSWDWHVF